MLKMKRTFGWMIILSCAFRTFFDLLDDLD